MAGHQAKSTPIHFPSKKIGNFYNIFKSENHKNFLRLRSTEVKEMMEQTNNNSLLFIIISFFKLPI